MDKRKNAIKLAALNFALIMLLGIIPVNATVSAGSPPRFNVTVSANNQWGGVGIDDGLTTATTRQFSPNDTVQLRATPDDLYVFERWEVLTGTPTSLDATSPNATFTMPSGDVSLRAIFVPKAAPYRVFLESSNAYGSVEYVDSNSWWPPTGSIIDVLSGTTVSLVATPNLNCIFVRWEVTSGTAPGLDVNNRNATFTMPSSDVHISAVFEPAPGTYTVTHLGTATHGGSVTTHERSVTYVHYPGDAVELVATSNDLYLIERWDVVSGNVPGFAWYVDSYSHGDWGVATFTMPSNNVTVRSVIARRAEFSVAVETNNHWFGSVEIDGTLNNFVTGPQGMPVKLVAVPKPNCVFVRWEVTSGTVPGLVPTANPVTINMPASDSYIWIRAVFEPEPGTYTVTQVNNINLEGQLVDASGTFVHHPGQSVRLGAVASPGNLLVIERWDVTSGTAPGLVATGLFTKHSVANFTMPSSNVTINTVFVEQQTSQRPWSLTPSSYTFPPQAAGYGLTAAESLVISNPGPGALTSVVASASPNFEVVVGVSDVVSAGEFAPVQVRPRPGLPPGNYTGELTVYTDNSGSRTVSLAFTVTGEDGLRITVPFGDSVSGGSQRVKSDLSDEVIIIEGGEIWQFVNFSFNGILLTRDIDYRVDAGSVRITIYSRTFERYGNEGSNRINATFNINGVTQSVEQTFTLTRPNQYNPPPTPSISPLPPPFIPPQQTYTPPQQTYTPPQQTYTPPQQTYTPPVQTYVPQQPDDWPDTGFIGNPYTQDDVGLPDSGAGQNGGEPVPFGRPSQTGVPSLTAPFAALCVGLVISSALWVSIFRRIFAKRKGRTVE